MTAPVRIELILLSALAATALGVLIDSARRAALGIDDAGDERDLVVPRASIEELERASSRLDDHAARALIVAGVGAVIAGALCLTARVATPELGAVLAAAGLGLALPGLSWACDVRRRRAALAERIEKLRGHIEATETPLPISQRGLAQRQSPRGGISRRSSGAPLMRSVGLPRRS